jgi:cytochrome oxidase Cu insertion factor (SCO1/SenC/PrrC family)
MNVASNTPSTTNPPKNPIARGITWLVGRWWFWVLAVAILFAQPLVRTFLRPPPSAPPVGAGLPDFHLVRETGEPFDPRTVSGRVWVASFVKPGAPDADATLEAVFALQKRLRNMGDAIRLVTLPSDDSAPPASTMAGLSRAHHANARVWLFATGEPMDVARLRAAFGVPDGPSSTRLWLVDSRGYLRGSYERDHIDSLVEDLSVLANGQ